MNIWKQDKTSIPESTDNQSKPKHLHMPVSEIIARYRSSKNKKEQITILAQMNLCTAAIIIDILKQAGVLSEIAKDGRGMKTKWDAEKAYELYQQGLTDGEIADEVGASSRAITGWRYRHYYVN